MQNIKKFIFGLFNFSLILLILFNSTFVFAEINHKIIICTDANFWYPFTFVRNHQAAGLHIDIISKALRNLGYEPQFKPASWQACLDLAKAGKIDAIATASYRDDRAIYLEYPSGAAVDIKSPWRVTDVEYSVITPLRNKEDKKVLYEFTGNVKTIPQPVRVPAKYSVASDLKKEGLTVEEGKNSLANFKSLVKEKTGSVVDLAGVAKYYAAQPQFADKYIIQKKPFNLKSYYLAFSKKSSIKRDDMKIIWKEIANVRENTETLSEFFKKY